MDAATFSQFQCFGLFISAKYTIPKTNRSVKLQLDGMEDIDKTFYLRNRFISLAFYCADFNKTIFCKAVFQKNPAAIVSPS
jgi:hypothetical protein